MKLTRRAWLRLRSLARVAGCLVTMWLVGMAAARAQAVSTTVVQGTVYLANGQPAGGTLVVSWPTFTTAAGQLISAGQTTVTVGADGFVSVNLAPNVGATPAGEYYTAVFYKSDGTVSTQYWIVPAAAQASLAQVQAQVMPAAQAVQAVSKAYVDQSVAQALGSQLLSSGGNLTGPLYLNGDPSQPLQAADKHYVDSSFSAALPLSGGTITGPASFSAAVTFGSNVTASSGINFTGTGAAQTLSNLLPGAASDGNNGATLAGNLKSSSVNNVWDLKAKFGAVGSNATMSCTAAASSYVLTGCSGGDFVAGEYVYLPFAGAASTISAPAAPTVACASTTGTSCTGSTQYCYELASMQNGYFAGPITAVSSATCVTQATQSPYGSTADIHTTVGWTTPTGGNGVIVYKSVNGGPYTLYLPNTNTGVGPLTSWNDYGQATSSQFTCTDMGVPCTAPSSSVASGVWAQIASISGSTVTLQARNSPYQPAFSDPSKPGISGSVTVEHDDTPAFIAANNALLANQGGGLVQVHIPQGNYPVYTYATSTLQVGEYGTLFLTGLNNVTFSGDGKKVTNILVGGSYFGSFLEGQCGAGSDPTYCTSRPWPIGSSGVGYTLDDPASVGNATITLATPSDSSNFSVGGWILVFDVTSNYPENMYTEINQVLAINSTTGVLSLKYPLTKTYSATLPVPYSSCSTCNGTPKAYPIGGGLVASNLTFENMTVRGPVLFGVVNTEDGLTIQNDDIEVQNFLLLGIERHLKILNNYILEDPWSPQGPDGLLMAAAGSNDEVAQGNTYVSPHYIDTYRQECSEGSANISDIDNQLTFAGDADPAPSSSTNSPLFWEPLCFNYTLSGNTVTAQFPVGNVFGGDAGYGASGVMKDNIFNIQNPAFNGPIGAVIGGQAVTSPYIMLDKNKFIYPPTAQIGPITFNANETTGGYNVTTFNSVNGAVQFYHYVGASNIYVLNLAAGGSVGPIIYPIGAVPNYKFTLIFVQPASGSVASFASSPCSAAFWNFGSQSDIDCGGLSAPALPTANGSYLIMNFYADSGVLHYLGSNTATAASVNTGNGILQNGAAVSNAFSSNAVAPQQQYQSQTPLVYSPNMTTSSCSSTSGLSNASGGGLIATTAGTTGTCTINFAPLPINAPWRINTAFTLSDATNGVRIQIGGGLALETNPDTTTASISADWNGFVTVLSGYGTGSGVPSGTTMNLSLYSDGAYVCWNLFPDGTALAGLSPGSNPGYEAAWTGDAYSSCTANTSAHLQSISNVILSNSSTSSKLLGVYVQAGSLDGPSDGLMPAPLLVQSTLPVESAAPGSGYYPWSIALPDNYGTPAGTPLVFSQHANGNPGVLSTSAAQGVFAALVRDGYAVMTVTGDPQGNYSDATASNWNAPAGQVYRQQAVAYARALFPGLYQLFHFGMSMGGLNAAGYELNNPGSAAIYLVSPAVNLTNACNNTAGYGGFTSIIQAAYGSWWQAIQANTNENPTSTSGFWKAINSGYNAPSLGYYDWASSRPAPGGKFYNEEAWSSGTAYDANDIVYVPTSNACSTLAAYDPSTSTNEATLAKGPPLRVMVGSADTLINPADQIAFCTRVAAAAGGTCASSTGFSGRYSYSEVSGQTHLGGGLFIPSDVTGFFDTYRTSWPTTSGAPNSNNCNPLMAGCSASGSGASVRQISPGLVTPTIGSGSTINAVNYYSTASITPTAVTAATCSDQTFSVSGLATGDKIGQIIPPGALGNVSVTGYVSTSGTVLLHFCNPSASSVTPPAGVYSFVDFR